MLTRHQARRGIIKSGWQHRANVSAAKKISAQNKRQIISILWRWRRGESIYINDAARIIGVISINQRKGSMALANQRRRRK